MGDDKPNWLQILHASFVGALICLTIIVFINDIKFDLGIYGTIFIIIFLSILLYITMAISLGIISFRVFWGISDYRSGKKYNILAFAIFLGVFISVVSTLVFPGNIWISSITLTATSSISSTTLSPTYTAYPTLIPTPINPNIGRLEITYPIVMKLDEGDFLSAEIVTDPLLNLSSPNASGLISIEKRSNNGKRNQYVAEIKLAPVMIAELQAQNFEVSNNILDNRRTIKAGTPVGWVWNIIAKRAGEQTILVNVYSQIESNGEKSISLTKASSINIQVEDKSFLEKISGFFAQNLVPIVSTGGPLGLILAYLVYRSNREKQRLEDKFKEAEKKIEELEKRLGIPPSHIKEEEKQKRSKRK